MESTSRDADDPGGDPGAATGDSSAARAEAAIRAIAAGADPGAEALNLSNRFTDDLTLRARTLFRRRSRRGTGSGSGSEKPE